MAEDELEDMPQEEEEAVVEKPGVDYDELDLETGFKKIEHKIWTAFSAAVLEKPEDEREEPDEWGEAFAAESNYDPARVKAVVTLGIYAGDRDEFNQRTGEGKAIYPNGDTYEGQYWEGKKNGKGMYVYKSSPMSEVDKLISQLRFTMLHGETDADFVTRAAKTVAVGTEIVKAALEYGFFPCYRGDYVNNLRHGKGVAKNKDGTVYKGDWKDNKRSGEGMFYYLNGDVFSGKWENGLKHGLGCYTFAGNKGHYTGLWENGIFKEGQWAMSDGNIYEGKFDSKNRPCDSMGAIKFQACQLVQQGEYDKGKWSPTEVLILSRDYDAAKLAAPSEGSPEAAAPVQA
eukprot:RCo037376